MLVSSSEVSRASSCFFPRDLCRLIVLTSVEPPLSCQLLSNPFRPTFRPTTLLSYDHTLQPSANGLDGPPRDNILERTHYLDPERLVGWARDMGLKNQGWSGAPRENYSAHGALFGLQRVFVVSSVVVTIGKPWRGSR